MKAQKRAPFGLSADLAGIARWRALSANIGALSLLGKRTREQTCPYRRHHPAYCNFEKLEISEARRRSHLNHLVRGGFFGAIDDEDVNGYPFTLEDKAEAFTEG